MKLPRRQFLHLAAGAASVPAVSRVAWAQAYPTRPVRLIDVGFPPGGGADTAARIIGPCCAPAGTPVEIIKRLNREISAGLATADIRARLSDVGTIPMILSAAEFGAFVAAEAEKWTKVVKFAGVKPE
jgi:tripartite-type tricarboxylate transporter receptor subunit TctC